MLAISPTTHLGLAAELKYSDIALYPSSDRTLDKSFLAESARSFSLISLNREAAQNLKHFLFIEYANKFFTIHKNNAGKKLTNEDLVAFSKEPLKKPLIKMPDKDHET